MPEPQAHTTPPSGGGRPPAPPATDEPGRRPDPSDPGRPIVVLVNGVPLGDLGNQRVDARLLTALLLLQGHVAQWLRARGVDHGAVEATFPGCGLPPHLPLSSMHQPPDPSDPGALIRVDLDEFHVGCLGHRDADARLVSAIALREGRVGEWLAARGVEAADVDAAFPGSSWR